MHQLQFLLCKTGSCNTTNFITRLAATTLQRLIDITGMQPGHCTIVHRPIASCILRHLV